MLRLNSDHLFQTNNKLNFGFFIITGRYPNLKELNLLDKIHTICSNVNYTTAVHTGAYDNYSKDVEFETLEKLKEHPNADKIRFF